MGERGSDSCQAAAQKPLFRKLIILPQRPVRHAAGSAPLFKFAQLPFFLKKKMKSANMTAPVADMRSLRHHQRKIIDALQKKTIRAMPNAGAARSSNVCGG